MRGQALSEYVVAVAVLLLFLGVLTMPRSPLNLMNMLKGYHSGIIRSTNKPVP